MMHACFRRDCDLFDDVVRLHPEDLFQVMTLRQRVKLKSPEFPEVGPREPCGDAARGKHPLVVTKRWKPIDVIPDPASDLEVCEVDLIALVVRRGGLRPLRAIIRPLIRRHGSKVCCRVSPSEMCHHAFGGVFSCASPL